MLAGSQAGLIPGVTEESHVPLWLCPPDAPCEVALESTPQRVLSWPGHLVPPLMGGMCAVLAPTFQGMAELLAPVLVARLPGPLRGRQVPMEPRSPSGGTRAQARGCARETPCPSRTGGPVHRADVPSALLRAEAPAARGQSYILETSNRPPAPPDGRGSGRSPAPHRASTPLPFTEALGPGHAENGPCLSLLSCRCHHLMNS